MIILSIETSCDDTCIALIKVTGKKRPYFEVLSNIVSSQVKIHKKFGGVYPAMAKREHQRNLVSVFERVFKKAKLLKLKTFAISCNKNQKLSQIKNPARNALFVNNTSPTYNASDNEVGGHSDMSGHSDAGGQELKKILEREPKLFKKLLNFFKKYQKPQIDIIAITIGPGLEPCLWAGVNFAKALSCIWNLPIIPVNHIEGHIFANWLSPIRSNSKFKNQKSKCNSKIKNEKIEFPVICLIVSGGHTQLILMTSLGKYKIIGETRDDAAGECFDKTARILGLGYPGGPIVAKMATKIKNQNSKIKIILPRPMIYSKDYDFSFSGLKTAVLYKTKSEKRKAKSEKYVQAMCKEIQQAIIDVLIRKTLKAVQNYRVKTIILGGGVVANQELRKQFFQKIKKASLPLGVGKIHFLVPSKNLCTDNAVMIAITAFFNRQKKTKNLKNIKADANLRIK